MTFAKSRKNMMPFKFSLSNSYSFWALRNKTKIVHTRHGAHYTVGSVQYRPKDIQSKTNKWKDIYRE